MELTAGKVAVVTGAASGIGWALAERFARAGLDVVLADVEQPALQAASEKIAGLGAKTLAVPTDVSDEAAVNALAAAAIDRFGAVHVVCNNAGVSSLADPWFGPLSAWKWVLGVNLWGVIHGIRAFLPVLAAQGEGHIVNTASIAGLIPGTGPIYDAAKHAVVAISEDLYRAMNMAMLPIGVSVLCPGWVRTSILQADRNWPQSLGEVPPRAATAEVTVPHVQRAVDEGMAPAGVAELVADAIAANRFWIFTDPHLTEIALDRWQRIAEGHNPQTDVDVPGMPPAKQLVAEIQRLLTGQSGGLQPARSFLAYASEPSSQASCATSTPREPAASFMQVSVCVSPSSGPDSCRMAALSRSSSMAGGVTVVTISGNMHESTLVAGRVRGRVAFELEGSSAGRKPLRWGVLA